MKVDGYSSEELKSFHRILQTAIAEIGALRVEFPISDMIARLFEAADNGERDPAKLRSAMLLGIATSGASRSAARRVRAMKPAPIATRASAARRTQRTFGRSYVPTGRT